MMMSSIIRHLLTLQAISSLIAARLMVDAFFVSNSIVQLMKHATGGRVDRSNRRDVLLFSQEPSSPNDQSTGGTSTSTSIGDITQNLHGGKYQFSDTQYLAGSSLMGQQFAESLYSSSCHDDEDAVFEEEDDELPKWALKLQQPDEHDGKQLTGILSFSDNVKSHTISITNDERSWEKYYAYILPNNNLEQYFQISSLRGHLAPRGGASNACDASKPYSDSASVTIELIGDNHAAITGQRVLLVVGTEAEIWRYQLNVEE